VFRRYAALLKARAAHPAFNPYGSQRVIESNDAMFAVLRSARDGSDDVLCLHNVSSQPQSCRLRLEPMRPAVDLLTGRMFKTEDVFNLTVNPYEVLWLALTH
jgi:hypothetical protein